MRFYVVRAKAALLWIIGALMLLFALGVGTGRIAGRDWPSARAVSIKLSDESADFSLQVVSVSAQTRRTKRVFIYHTHTYEAYEMDAENPYTPTETWRTADESCNVVRVGEELAACLRAAGVETVHDTTAYEPPKLSTAYSRSLEGLKKAAEDGYDLYIDLHRDSYSKGNGDNTVTVEGKPAARILILIGQGTGTGFDEKPDWERNEKAAKIISDFLNARREGLCRGVSLKSGRYNQQAASPSMLIEVGNNKNTLPEAISAVEPLARAICQYFDTLE